MDFRKKVQMNLSNGHRKFLRKFVLLDDYTFLGYYFYSLLKKKGKIK